MTYKSNFISLRDAIFNLIKSKAEMTLLLIKQQQEKTNLIKAMELKKAITKRNAELYIKL